MIGPVPVIRPRPRHLAGWPRRPPTRPGRGPRTRRPWPDPVTRLPRW